MFQHCFDILNNKPETWNHRLRRGRLETWNLELETVETGSL
jgi:hypothetical protein